MKNLRLETPTLRLSTPVLIIVAMALLIFATSVGPGLSAPPEKNIDTAFLPISASQLRAAIQANSHNAVELVQLLRQADNDNLADTAYDTLNQMRQHDPKNAVVLAAYYFAVRIGAGFYMGYPDRPRKIRSDILVAFGQANVTFPP